MRAGISFLCRTLTWIMILCLLGMTVVINSLVVTRYFFSYSPSWTEEVTRYSMIWLIMLGAGVLTLFEDHITLYIGVEKLPPRARWWQRLFAYLVVLAAGLLIAWTGFDFSLNMAGILAPGLQMSMTLPMIAIPIGATLISAFAALRIVSHVSEGLGGRPIDLPAQSAFMDGSFKPAEESAPDGEPSTGGERV